MKVTRRQLRKIIKEASSQAGYDMFGLGYDVAAGDLREKSDREFLNYMIERLIEISPEFADGFDQGSTDARDMEDRENV